MHGDHLRRLRAFFFASRFAALRCWRFGGPASQGVVDAYEYDEDTTTFIVLSPFVES